MKPWVTYSLLRLVIFGVVLAVLLLVGVPDWVAAIFAAIIGLSVAYLFFRPQRDALIESVTRVPTTDEAAEDADDDEHADR